MNYKLAKLECKLLAHASVLTVFLSTTQWTLAAILTRISIKTLTVIGSENKAEA